MQTLLGKHWHHLPAPETMRLLDSNLERGLDLFELQHRRERFGRNELTPRRRTSALVRFLHQFNNPLIYILLASALITALLKDPLDAIVILLVVVINALVSYIQESRAEESIEALARSMTVEASVLRGGRQQRVPAADLVPGDIVLIQSGSQVPADLRLVAARDLQVAEASLTGESAPVAKDALALHDPDTTLADRNNMAYASTMVSYGQGTGVVVATGDYTEIGRISQLLSQTPTLETPLTTRIRQFSRVLLYAILAMAAATFAVGVTRGQPALETLSAAIALAVAMIPEGLPAALTITLSIGVARMARRRAIIRKLPAVETLSVSPCSSPQFGRMGQCRGARHCARPRGAARRWRRARPRRPGWPEVEFPGECHQVIGEQGLAVRWRDGPMRGAGRLHRSSNIKSFILHIPIEIADFIFHILFL